MTISSRPHVRRVGVSLTPPCLEPSLETALRGLAESAYPNETGGLLLGWWQDGVPVVNSVAEVPDPNAGRTCWTRDETPAVAVLAAHRRATDNPLLGYVGDWHSHPANLGPSSADLRELRRISRQYTEPLLLLVVRKGGPIDGYRARSGRLLKSADIATRPIVSREEQW
jgi:integrative and conjugative element protein (TIGR02256 family)